MKTIDEMIAKHPDQSDLIDLLSEIQEEYGYLSEENMRYIEQKLGIPLVEIYGVATFYASFRLKPVGKHIIRVCKGTACHVKKADLIEGVIDDVLGIRDKETTEDGRFTLERVNCIGACAKAPNIMVDDVVYGELTKEKVEKILREFPKE
ncbi:MAG: NADH-quinone oxidoreductase subunit NuoE [Candidatus Altiarchaeia archaeon]